MVDVLTDAEAVIDALGGTAATTRITKRKDMRVVSNWRKSGKLPADTFLVLSAELKRIGKTAPPAVWGISEPASAEP